MNMKIAPIEIDVSDNKTFAQIAFLVDNPSFLSEVSKIRNKYKIPKPLEFNFATFITHFIKLTGIETDRLPISKDVQLGIDGFSYLFEELNRLLDYLTEHQDEDLLGKELFQKVLSLERQFFTDVTVIRRKFHFPIIFDSVVFQAILFNRVQVFSTAIATSLNIPAYSIESNLDIDEDTDKVMVIIATPYSTEKDVIEAFRKGITRERDITESSHPLNQTLEKDTVTNIKRDRAWYWRRMNGERPHDIAVADYKGWDYHQKYRSKKKYLGDLPEKLQNEYARYEIHLFNFKKTIRTAIHKYKELITTPTS